MQALCFHRRSSRRIIWSMLLAWVFALGAGVVNACVLTPSWAGHHASGAREHHEVRVGGAPIVLADQIDDSSTDLDADRQSPSHDACLKYCDDESTALSKSNVPAVDPSLPVAALLAWWSPVTPVAHIGPWLPREHHAVPEPPLVIRLLRLTL
jgi:hypothetical protein